MLIASGDAQLLNIITVTMRMSIASSLISLLLGVPIGIAFANRHLIGRKALVVINRTFMGLPPVVCGLICYMLFSGVGPFGRYGLLFTIKAMVIAQVILITPQVIGTTEMYASDIITNVEATAVGLGLGHLTKFMLVINECRYQVITTYLFSFSRSIAEVGAVSMVGGAIAYKTNVMTTAIMMATNRGDFTLGVALGIILICLAFALNLIVYIIQVVIDR